MDEFTFEAYIVPLVTSLRFGEQLYYLTAQIEDALQSLAEDAEALDSELYLVD
jgi:hypothetical protein